MDENPTVVNFAEVRSATTTTTGNAKASKEQKVSSQSNQFGQGIVGGIPYIPQPIPLAPAPSDPFDNFYMRIIIGFIFSWLIALTYFFYIESKDINNKISANQEETLKLISSYQIDLKNQISDFERRHEADMRELQKMILQQQNISK